jgi:hypothetical protein
VQDLLEDLSRHSVEVRFELVLPYVSIASEHGSLWMELGWPVDEHTQHGAATVSDIVAMRLKYFGILQTFIDAQYASMF